ncbi:MAG: hypothetical protein FWG53_04050, partial [Clostridiales bacterium]|nr:hypothetical protein [Clostridiales bacterium]
MKAILMSHEHGGSYVMNQDGCFQFVKGYASQPVGTQIDIKPQVQPLVFYAKAAKVAALAA